MLYVCLITAPGHVVESVRCLEVPSDAHACDEAVAFARSFSSSHGYEVWREGRKIAALFPRPQGGDTTPRPPKLRLVKKPASG